jgi:Na+/H+ antiporter NhaD/arsenite permease-like protein
VLFPFHVPVYIPRSLSDAVLNTLSAIRVIPPKQNCFHHGLNEDSKAKRFLRLNLPINYTTAPLIADLFLLAIVAIGRQEVYDGTIGADNISPLDVILVFLALGYIANSIEKSGLIKYLVFKVLPKIGGVGHRLFVYLYLCFFCLGIFIGNDPLMVLFLFDMNLATSNIAHPRAWIHTQFAVANIATAILVTSNPTNLVLAGAFNIKFVTYTANMIVPVISTAILLCPFLLYILFAQDALIPIKIELRQLTAEEETKKPRNPNIPDARKSVREHEGGDEGEAALYEAWLDSAVKKILNPFLDKSSAAFGAIIMASTIIILLVLNAVYLTRGGHSDYWVALPAAFIMFSWDLVLGWHNRHDTREVAREYREEAEKARAERAMRETEEAQRTSLQLKEQECFSSPTQTCPTAAHVQTRSGAISGSDQITNTDEITPAVGSADTSSPFPTLLPNPIHDHQNAPSQELPDTVSSRETDEKQELGHTDSSCPSQRRLDIKSSGEDEEDRGRDTEQTFRETECQLTHERPTLISLVADVYRWSRETFPTATAALGDLPLALVPFTFSMFVLVQALVHKGWVPIFAHGWDLWINKTGTVGSIGGMGFLSAILCNVSFHTKTSYWV